MRIALAVLALFAGAASLQEGKRNPPPIPGWNPDIEAGLAEARKSGKPALVVFR